MRGGISEGAAVGREEDRAAHHVASFAAWCPRHSLFAPSLPTPAGPISCCHRQGGLTLSEMETYVTSGFPGLGGKKRPSV